MTGYCTQCGETICVCDNTDWEAILADQALTNALCHATISEILEAIALAKVQSRQSDCNAILETILDKYKDHK
jgi:hypothetical protein